MKTRRFSMHWTALLAAGVLLTAAPTIAQAQYGTVLSAAGPINRSFGGAAVASPLSAAGALLWNPATMSGFQRSELETGAELLFPHSTLESRFSSNSFGPGIPPVDLAGRTRSTAGAFPLPTIAMVYRPKCSDWTLGLGVFALAGFGVDYPGSNTNPLLGPRLPNGFGLGPAFSQYQVVQIAPSASFQLTERFSIAAGPTLNLAALQLDPGLFAVPDDANGDRFASYPSATHSRSTWGGGFTVGMYYRGDTWSLGSSIKSPQWFDKFRFNSFDERNRPRSIDVGLDLPMIVSAGASYNGFERWVFASDFRYLDYASTNGFGERGFTANGALRGLGWRSVFAIASGAQFRLNDAVTMRMGYSWNSNPIASSQSSVNSLTPLTLQHILSAGFSWNITPCLAFSAAYTHGFQNSVEGPLVLPTGAVAGTSVRNLASGDMLTFGFSGKFGSSGNRRRVGRVSRSNAPTEAASSMSVQDTSGDTSYRSGS